jgi:hypothetical protein
MQLLVIWHFKKTTLRQLIYLLIFSCLFSCVDSKTTNHLQTSTLDIKKSAAKFPVRAKFKNPEQSDKDTLIATVNQTDFSITPDGKLSWGQKLADIVHLKTEVYIEAAYLFMESDTLFVFYTETDHDGSTSRLEKIDLKIRKSIWQTEIYAFNLGIPYIIDNFAYVTTIGTIGKIDLVSGKYIFQFRDLYDNKKSSFNSFDSIIFQDSLAIFISKNINSKRVDSIIVNEKKGERTVRK